MTAPTFLSLGAFYAADKRRDISREHDLGLWWLGDDWHAPRFRAAWVAETGELYLMQHEGTAGGGHVDIVATGALEELETRLEGWRDMVGEWGSLRWLLERLGPDVPGRLLHAAGMTSEPEPPASHGRWPVTWRSCRNSPVSDAEMGTQTLPKWARRI